jgi:hypothetical protein
MVSNYSISLPMTMGLKNINFSKILFISGNIHISSSCPSKVFIHIKALYKGFFLNLMFKGNSQTYFLFNITFVVSANGGL